MMTKNETCEINSIVNIKNKNNTNTFISSNCYGTIYSQKQIDDISTIKHVRNKESKISIKSIVFTIAEVIIVFQLIIILVFFLLKIN